MPRVRWWPKQVEAIDPHRPSAVHPDLVGADHFVVGYATVEFRDRGSEFFPGQMRPGAAVRACAERQVAVRATAEVDHQRRVQLVGIH